MATSLLQCIDVETSFGTEAATGDPWRTTRTMTDLDFSIDDLRRNWNRKADGRNCQIGADGDSNRRRRLLPTAERWLGDVRNCRALDAGAERAEFRQDDCQRLDTCGDGEFDLVASVYVLQDLPDLDAALAAFARVLRPGGRCVLAFSHPCFSVPGGPIKTEAGPVYRCTGPYFQDRS
jgi:SAM-dependent methyltransferase